MTDTKKTEIETQVEQVEKKAEIKTAKKLEVKIVELDGLDLVNVVGACNIARFR